MTTEKITLEDFSAICENIAKYFPGWALEKSGESYDYRHTLTNPDGLQICLSTSRHDREPRLRVSTWTWPKYIRLERGEQRSETVFPNSLYDPKESAPEITCALNRPAEKLAAEIKRRFLPEYIRIWTRAKERADQCQEHENRSIHQWMTVCRELKLDPKHNHHYISVGGDHNVTIENNNGSLKMEFYANKDQVLRVVAALKNK